MQQRSHAPQQHLFTSPATSQTQQQHQSQEQLQQLRSPQQSLPHTHQPARVQVPVNQKEIGSSPEVEAILADIAEDFVESLTTDIHKERIAAIKKSVTVMEAANARNPYRHGMANARGELSRAYSLMRPSSIDSPGAAQQSLQAINQPWLSSSGQGNQAKTVSSENEVSDNRIHELLQQIDPSEKLDPEVAAILADIAEDFVESQLLAVLKPSIETTTFNLGLVSLFLKCRKNWNIRPPGFSSDEIKTFRKPLTTDIHKERLAAIKKSVTVTEAANARNPYRHGTANARGGQAKTPAKSLGLHNF
ncbi:hypothetical protein F2Q70_00037554 [Brassica cretica]|uniref:Transcription initiation factor TFIID subunit 12 domain-containing protein n=1 Tax=Brassica cretica TaxID=69181 RepID=A0A8S9JUM7_BRACR|nr:hypothetical protein F2Q70_00037554 [Brassica cretica]